LREADAVRRRSAGDRNWIPYRAKGKARVRTIVTATHTREELDRALDAFRRAGKKVGLL